MENQKRMGMRWSSVILLILGVYFYIHYSIYKNTNIYALESTVFGYFAIEFTSLFFRNKDVKNEWHFLVFGLAMAVCFIVTFILYFR